ncbi:crossover junction endodeoxyribonuclease RuvC [Candidatus Kaiserbacteria bacterium]|nr:crossover junction endodeoxyribonuclease RuvC [Candidatus Kaiserbacteria bacterium]
MRVLAIDPGYGRCGVAVIEKRDGKEILIFSDCIETTANDPFPERLATVADAAARLAEKYKPDCMALEKLYITKNQKTGMQVAEVRGALLQVAAVAGLPVSEYTPGQVKQAAAGWGGADKQTVAKMVRVLVRIEKDIRHDDEYDAIAVGITHLAHSR